MQITQETQPKRKEKEKEDINEGMTKYSNTSGKKSTPSKHNILCICHFVLFLLVVWRVGGGGGGDEGGNVWGSIELE